MAADYKKPKKLKIFLLATMLTALGAVIGIYITFQQDPSVSEGIPESTEPDATLSIGKIQHTATRKGKKEWSLEASSASYMGNTSQMVLKDLKVSFFVEDASEIELEADRGILNTSSNDIEVSGNVVVKNKDYKLVTEKLNYANDQRLLDSKAPVTISGPTVQMTADSVSFDLNTQKFTMEGSVETTLDINFTL